MNEGKIYTKTGDAGETSLLGGDRVTKDCINLQVIGEIDELNCKLGEAVVNLGDEELSNFLIAIQRDLFKAGAEIAAMQRDNLVASINKIEEVDIKKLEEKIDEYWPQLPELKNFILPGGMEAAAFLHSARAICRRAERALVSLGKEKKVRSELYKYFNRLSDFLFAAARYVNIKNGREDIVV